MSSPPQGGYTAEDLDRLPDLPSHTELIDGRLVFRSPQTYGHMRAVSVLDEHLVRCAPPEVVAIREMTVTLGPRNRPESDLMLVRAEAAVDGEMATFQPEDVLFAVEVVSSESADRDRDTKPRTYAAAGIRHFWRVEKDGRRAVVYTFELEPATGVYVPTGVFRDRLKVADPFPVDIDLTEI